MNKSFNISNSLLIASLSVMIKLTLLGIALGFLYISIFSVEIEIMFYFLAFTLILTFSQMPDINTTSHLLTLYYFRKNTQQFIIDFLKNKLLFLVAMLFVFSIGTTLLEPSKLTYVTHLTPGMMAQLFILTYLLIIYMDIVQSQGIIRLRSSSNLSFRTSLLNFIKPALCMLAAFLCIMITFIFSFALGSFLFSVLIFLFILYNELTKVILTAYYRRKFAVAGILSLLLFTLFLSGIEWLNGNHKFLYYENSYLIIETRAFTKRPKVSKEKGEVKSFYTWTLWMDEHTLNAKEYAQAFTLLEELCPPYKRLNSFTVYCTSCIDKIYSISSQYIKSLTEDERTQRTEHLLLEQDSEYANLVGLVYYRNLDKPDRTLTALVEQISKDQNHVLNDLAKRVLNDDYQNKDPLNIYFVTKPNEDNACSN